MVWLDYGSTHLMSGKWLSELFPSDVVDFDDGLEVAVCFRPISW